MAAVVIAGSAAAGAGITAALAARHGGHHHHRHVHMSVRCAEAPHAREAGATVVAVDPTGAVVVSGATFTDKRRKVRKRRRCRRAAGEGVRIVVTRKHASGAVRSGHAGWSDHATEADALRLRLDDVRVRLRLGQARRSSGEATERLKQAVERMEHAM